MDQLNRFAQRGVAAQRAVDRATDTSTWLTKAEAAQRAGVAPKTIERWVKDGKLQQGWRRRPTGPRLAVVHPGDVDRLARERTPELPPFVEPVRTAPPAALAPREPDAPAAALATFLGLVQALMSQMSETSQTWGTPCYVDTATACARTGLGRRHLHQARRAGTVQACRTGGRWVWRAADFAKL